MKLATIAAYRRVDPDPALPAPTAEAVYFVACEDGEEAVAMVRRHPTFDLGWTLRVESLVIVQSVARRGIRAWVPTGLGRIRAA